MPNAMYLRKSRAEEASESTEEVLAKHRAALFELADRLGIIVTDVYEEVVSGERLYLRPEMLRLLEAVRAGAYDSVLCMDIDRLGRGDMADQGIILDAFRSSETLIVTPDKTYDLQNESDEESTEMKAFFARWEYRSIRRRMKRGLMQTIQAGGYTANEPYGYRKIVVNKLPTLEIVPEEARFIRYIYDSYLKGIGTTTIARDLNAMGSRPKREALWSRETVRSILLNPVYCGKIAWNRVKRLKPEPGDNRLHRCKYIPQDEWTIFDGIHEAIISEETWCHALELRKKRHVTSQKTGKVMNPFAGLMFCSQCGSRMQQMGQNKGVNYILCPTKGCSAGAKTAYVENRFIKALEDILRVLRSDILGYDESAITTLRASLEAIESEIERHRARIPKLYDLLEDGLYDKDTFRSRMELAEKEIKALTSRQSEIEKEIESRLRLDKRQAAISIESILSAYPNLTPDQKNRLLKNVIDRIVYTKYKKTKPLDFTLHVTLRDFSLP